jgi:hypothetical protein
MKKICVFLILGLFVISVLKASGTEELGPEEILARANENWVGLSFHGIVRLEIIRPERSRLYRMEVWSESEGEGEKFLIKIIEPEDEAGSGYLKVGDELWYYSPKIGQAVPLPPLAQGEAFLGSDLALEDVFKDTLSGYYDVELLGRDDQVYTLILIPKPDAPVIYGKLEVRVRVSDYALSAIFFYDQRETLIRVATFSEFIRTELRQRVVPRKVVVEDYLKQGERTIQYLETYEFDISIPPEVFTLEFLKGS